MGEKYEKFWANFYLPKRLILILLLHTTVGNVPIALYSMQSTYMIPIRSFFQKSFNAMFSIQNSTLMNAFFSIFTQLGIIGIIGAIIVYKQIVVRCLPMFCWLKLAQFLFIIGCILMTLGITNNYLILASTANVIFGAASFSFYIKILYLPEFGLPKDKTKIVLFSNSVMFILNFLVAIVTNENVLGNENRWFAIYVLMALTSVLYLTVTWNMPESPKQLYLIKGNTSETIDSLRFYHGMDVDTQQIIDQFVDEKHFENILTKLSLREVFKRKYIRKVILIIALNIIVDIVSLSSITGKYGQFILEKYSDMPSVITYLKMSGSCISLAGSFVAPILFSRLGIRNSVVTIFGLSVLAWIFMIMAEGAFYAINTPNTISFFFYIIGTVIEELSSGLGKRKIFFILMNELCPEEAKDSVATFMLTISIFGIETTGLTILPIYTLIGITIYIIYFIITIICITIFISIVPNSKENLYESLHDGYKELK
uniref:MFS domain-containing protein n=1 Tax=Rhabditophanes sp. KR3021 TaxID=114890 RepID=A0AC35U5I7_9BILA